MPSEIPRGWPIMLQIAHADNIHQKWERRWSALVRMYAAKLPGFVDRDGEWCERELLDYMGYACGFTAYRPEESNDGQ